MGKVDSFGKSFDRTMLNEGLYSFDKMDPGGETYMAISRVYHPSCSIWPIIDKALANGRTLSMCIELPPMVRRFYKEEYWYPLMGDNVAKISEKVAMEIFDTAVNFGKRKAVKILQESLNLLNLNQRSFRDIVEDGIIGNVTLKTLDLFFDRRPPMPAIKEKMLLNVMNVLQGMHYVEQMRKYPEKEKYRGWFLRV